MKRYTDEALAYVRAEVLNWLEHHDGFPRSWDEEARRGRLIDDWPPVIAGYEALEREGIAERVGTVINAGGQERVHFRLVRQ